MSSPVLVPVLVMLVLGSAATGADALIKPGGTLANGKPVAGKPVTAKILKLQAMDLLERGKVAVDQARAGKMVERQAIVQAAVDFELARRLLVADPDPDLAQIVQENLFWTKKQFTALAIQAYTAAIAPFPASFPKVTLTKNKKGVGKSEGKSVEGKDGKQNVPKDPAEKPVVGPADNPLVDPWTRRLRQAIRSALTARKTVTVGVDPAFIPPKLQELTEDGVMTVKFLTGDPETREWCELSPGDQAGLALACCRENTPDQHALVAYFLVKAEDLAGARYQLFMAREKAAEVERALGINGR